MKYPSLRFVFDRKRKATKTKTGLVQIEVTSERKTQMDFHRGKTLFRPME